MPLTLYLMRVRTVGHPNPKRNAGQLTKEEFAVWKQQRAEAGEVINDITELFDDDEEEEDDGDYEEEEDVNQADIGELDDELTAELKKNRAKRARDACI